MALTEEQKEQIKKNRERALEIRRRKLAALSGGQTSISASSPQGNDGVSPRSENKRQKLGEESRSGDQEETVGEKDATKKGVEDEDDLEEFEIGAAPLVTKKEAMQMYCLPEGTLAVCSYVEKENPRNKSWTPMKLYERHELRRRARERYGGMDGLIEERNKRARKRFEKDLVETKDVFLTKR